MAHQKVLIVEDEENERTGLAELVSSWGYRVETARDGQDGLEKSIPFAPSIVVTDIKMPRMGGVELLQKLAAQAHPMAVIMVTAQGSIESAVQAMRVGASTTSPNPSTQPDFAPSFPTPAPCSALAPNSKPRDANFATPALSANSWDPPAKCRRCSA